MNLQREAYDPPELHALTAEELERMRQDDGDRRLVDWLAKRGRERIGDEPPTQPMASPEPLEPDEPCPPTRKNDGGTVNEPDDPCQLAIAWGDDDPQRMTVANWTANEVES